MQPPYDPRANPYAPPAPAPPHESHHHGFQTPSSFDAPGPGLPGPNVPLFNANQVALATFFGSILAGSVVMAVNEHRLRHPARVWPTVAIGFVATGIICAVAFALPENIPGFPITLATLLGMRAIAQKRQGAWVGPHLSAGGKKASGWAAFGIGMGGLFVLLVALVIIALAGGLGDLDSP